MLVMAPTVCTLQQLLQKAYIGLKTQCLKVNFEESKYIVFKRKLRVDMREEIETEGSSMKRMEQIKYLGIILDDQFKYSERCGLMLRFPPTSVQWDVS